MAKFETPPRFCNKHLKIHVCDEMLITNKLKKSEDEIGARVRRLHGTQTEEELAEEAKKIKKNNTGIGAILAAAKEKIAKDKKNAAENEIMSQTKVVSKEEVGDRMSALRAKMAQDSGDGTATTSSKSENNVNSISEPGEIGLNDIIQNAREISNKKWSDYKVPERSKIGEKEETEKEVKKTVKSKTKTVKKNAIKNDKRPSIAFEKSENDDNEYLSDNFEDNSQSVSETPKVEKIEEKPLKNISDSPLLTIEQTQELIEEAVKKALEAAGVAKKRKK